MVNLCEGVWENYLGMKLHVKKRPNSDELVYCWIDHEGRCYTSTGSVNVFATSNYDLAKFCEKDEV